ncbi:MAG: cytochrome c [Burkholderiaceae bacterium]|nr:cytochrome c [Burkholderiaceae bacterium]
MKRTLIAAALAACCATAWGGEAQFKLKDAPGVQQVYTNCMSCHSVDYIQLNSPFLDRKGWEGEVAKMIKAYGAPVKADDVPAIVDYLSSNYGKP